jgi:hypothetical protein
MILVSNDGTLNINFDEEVTVTEIPVTEKPEKPEKPEKTEKAENEVKELTPQEITPGRYRHFKGNEYEVYGFAKDSETGEKMVIYQAMYGEQEVWVRPYKMFQEIIERDGKKMRRFEKLS